MRMSMLRKTCLRPFIRSLSLSSNRIIAISNEVKDALKTGRPIVALETTIVSHGLPYPLNYETAVRAEASVRAEGCVPATIGIFHGVPTVGLTSEQIHEFSLPTEKVRKCSRRDIPLAIVQKAHGSTTVAATMILSKMAGIHVFVTGGIGGVHYGYENTMDMSADIIELSRTPICVISAGIKSVLDVSRSLEALETFGVPVISFGSREFPSFFSSSSGILSPAICHSVQEVAALFSASVELGMGNGMLVAVPNFHEEGKLIDEAVKDALATLHQVDIKGKDVTPFLLSKVSETSKGLSTEINVSLLENNVKIGSKIAAELTQISNLKSYKNVDLYGMRFANASTKNDDIEKKPDSEVEATSITVIGGCLLDCIARSSEAIISRTSVPGTVSFSYGGVARNITEALGKLNIERRSSIRLVSDVGDDTAGRNIIENLRSYGVNVSSIQMVSGHRTASYTALMDHRGELYASVADTEILHKSQLEHRVLPSKTEEDVRHFMDIVVIDGNVPSSSFEKIVKLSSSSNLIIFEPTSVPKSILPIECDALSYIDITTPNVDELVAMVSRLSRPNNYILRGFNLIRNGSILSNANFDIQSLEPLIRFLLEGMRNNGQKVNSKQHTKHVIVTLGKDGVLTGSSIGSETTVEFHHYPALNATPVNCTGAGDCFVAGLVHSLSGGRHFSESVQLGLKCASMSVQCAKAVPDSLHNVFDENS